MDGKAPVPLPTHGPPPRRGLHSPEVPSGLRVGTHKDNLSGDAPVIGFPTASPVLPGVISQVTATLTPLFQGQLLGDPTQVSSHSSQGCPGRRCAGRGGGGTGELTHRTADAGSAGREEASPPHQVASPGRKSLEKSIVSEAATPGRPGRGLRGATGCGGNVAQGRRGRAVIVRRTGQREAPVARVRTPPAGRASAAGS